jgi:hypothetical protein
MKVSGQLHTLASLASGKEPPPSTLWTGGWVGPRANLDMVVKREREKKNCLSQELNPGHPVCNLVTTLIKLFQLINIILQIQIIESQCKYIPTQYCKPFQTGYTTYRKNTLLSTSINDRKMSLLTHSKYNIF